MFVENYISVYVFMQFLVFLYVHVYRLSWGSQKHEHLRAVCVGKQRVVLSNSRHGHEMSTRVIPSRLHPKIALVIDSLGCLIWLSLSVVFGLLLVNRIRFG